MCACRISNQKIADLNALAYKHVTTSRLNSRLEKVQPLLLPMWQSSCIYKLVSRVVTYVQHVVVSMCRGCCSQGLYAMQLMSYCMFLPSSVCNAWHADGSSQCGEDGQNGG